MEKRRNDTRRHRRGAAGGVHGAGGAGAGAVAPRRPLTLAHPFPHPAASPLRLPAAAPLPAGPRPAGPRPRSLGHPLISPFLSGFSGVGFSLTLSRCSLLPSPCCTCVNKKLSFGVLFYWVACD